MRDSLIAIGSFLAAGLSPGWAAEAPAPGAPPAAAPEKPAAVPEIALPIASVTVYEDRALVQRSGEVDLAAGVSTIRVGGLPVNLDEGSLRAALAEGAAAKVTFVTTKTEEKVETQDEALKALEKEEETLDRALARLDARAGVKEDEERYLNALEEVIRKSLSEKTTTGVVKPAEIQGSADLLARRRGALAEEGRKIQTEREENGKKLDEVRGKIAQIATPQKKSVRHADVVIESTEARKVGLSISYLIAGAYWTPRYEARLSGGKLEVQYQGEVRQGTGEAWENVSLFLSTARPSMGAERPELAAVRLEPETRTVEVALVSSSKGALEGRTAEPDGAEIKPPPTDGVQIKDSGTSVVFEVPAKSTVPSDRRAYKLPVTSFRDDAPTLGYETVPKLLLYVYLKGKSTNRTSFPMLPGPVDIFRESGFIGTASVEFVAPGKPIELSFGIDEEIKVKRTPDKERTTKKEVGTLSTRVEHRFAFDTEITNYRSARTKVALVENAPVSDVEEVSVRIESATTAGYSRDPKTGHLTWDLDLEPGKPRTIHIEYVVTVPPDMKWDPWAGNIPDIRARRAAMPLH